MNTEKRRSSAKSLIPPISFTLAGALASILIYLSSADLIIPLGVKGYRLVQGGSVALSIVFALWFIAALIRFFINRQAEKAAEEPVTRKPIREGMLSASGKLSDEYVLGCIASQGTGKWRLLKPEIERVTDQLIMMNSYQDRLGHLLASNSASALSDAEGLLDKVEQQILGNVRKVLNYMEILGIEDKDTIAGYLAACEKDNARLLSSTKAFLISVTDYLNDQGEDSSKSLRMLEEFQSVLSGDVSFGQETGGEREQVTLKL